LDADHEPPFQRRTSGSSGPSAWSVEPTATASDGEIAATPLRLDEPAAAPAGFELVQAEPSHLATSGSSDPPPSTDEPAAQASERESALSAPS
jgi:hypothetical protein